MIPALGASSQRATTTAHRTAWTARSQCFRVCYVTQVRQATGAEWDAWQEDWRVRLERWYGQPDVPAEWATAQVQNRMAGRQSAAVTGTFALVSDETTVGILALRVVDQGGTKLAVLDDVLVRSEHRRLSHAGHALQFAANWALENEGGSLWVTTDPADEMHSAVFASYPIRAHQMIKRLSATEPLAEGLEGQSMSATEFEGWREEAVRGYAADMMDSGSMPANLAYTESARQFDHLLPDGLHTANHTFLSLYSNGEQVATNWIGHKYAPGTSWVYGVEVHENERGKGYGRAAMVIGEQATVDAGDTHLGLNVFGHNDVAISLYNGMGYRAYEYARSIDL